MVLKARAFCFIHSDYRSDVPSMVEVGRDVDSRAGCGWKLKLHSEV